MIYGKINSEVIEETKREGPKRIGHNNADGVALSRKGVRLQLDGCPCTVERCLGYIRHVRSQVSERVVAR